MLKNLAKKIVLRTLIFLARRRIRPDALVIGITGSVGKTTTKEALKKILASRFLVHANRKSFNSEFGVPLTLLEEESGYASACAWLGILTRSFRKSFTSLPAEKIILELGVDHPGDMDALLEIIHPALGIVTAVASVHLAPGQFTTLAEIAHEKSKLISHLPASGVALVNADDPLVAAMTTPARRITFGIQNPADIVAREITETVSGITAEIIFTPSSESARLNVPILGTHNLYSLLAALAAGIASGVPLAEGVASLVDFRLPPGRLNLLAGVNGSTLIDGSYNSNPASLAAALATFGELNIQPGGRKVALLGQMNELGSESARYHRELGEKVIQHAHEVVGVFGDACEFTRVAEKRGIPAHFFATAEEAGEYLKNILRPHDLVLVKGSQNKVRLEKAVAKLLAQPEKAGELLCRQEKYWNEK